MIAPPTPVPNVMTSPFLTPCIFPIFISHIAPHRASFSISIGRLKYFSHSFTSVWLLYNKLPPIAIYFLSTWITPGILNAIPSILFILSKTFLICLKKASCVSLGVSTFPFCEISPFSITQYFMKVPPTSKDAILIIFLLVMQ